MSITGPPVPSKQPISPPTPMASPPSGYSHSLSVQAPHQTPPKPSAPTPATAPFGNCEECYRGVPMEEYLYCNNCTKGFCRSCWPKPPQHGKGRIDPWGNPVEPHEPKDPLTEAKLNKYLEPRIGEAQQHALLAQDEETTWIAVVRDEADNLIFQDLGRYGNVSAGLHVKSKPALISFVGETGE